MPERPHGACPGDPIAEKTNLVWTIMSPGNKLNHTHMLLTHTSLEDYAELCQLNVLDLQDAPEHDQRAVYEEFHEQVHHSTKRWH